MNTAASTRAGDATTPTVNSGYSIPINAALRIADQLVARQAG